MQHPGAKMESQEVRDRKQLAAMELRIIEAMKQAIKDGKITTNERKKLDGLVAQLHEMVEADGWVTDEELMSLAKIETAMQMILNVEKQMKKAKGERRGAL